MQGEDDQHARICVLEKLLENSEGALKEHVISQEKQFKNLHILIHNIPKMISESRSGILSDISKVFSLVFGALVVFGWIYVYILKDIMEHVNSG